MRRAYTITELLVVMCIVVVLTAIIVPVLSSAKRQAGKAVCASNMHQIYLAAKLYENDYESYPQGLTDPAFKQYYPTVLMCPSSKNAAFPNLRAIDYTFVGTVSKRREGDAMNACRAARGSLLPLVFDDNHIDARIDKADYTSKVLVVRENGAFSVQPAAAAFLSKTPCDTTQVPYWYNL